MTINETTTHAVAEETVTYSSAMVPYSKLYVSMLCLQLMLRSLNFAEAQAYSHETNALEDWEAYDKRLAEGQPQDNRLKIAARVSGWFLLKASCYLTTGALGLIAFWNFVGRVALGEAGQASIAPILVAYIAPMVDRLMSGKYTINYWRMVKLAFGQLGDNVTHGLSQLCKNCIPGYEGLTDFLHKYPRVGKVLSEQVFFSLMLVIAIPGAYNLIAAERFLTMISLIAGKITADSLAEVLDAIRIRCNGEVSMRDAAVVEIAVVAAPVVGAAASLEQGHPDDDDSHQVEQPELAADELDGSGLEVAQELPAAVMRVVSREREHAAKEMDEQPPPDCGSRVKQRIVGLGHWLFGVKKPAPANSEQAAQPSLQQGPALRGN